MAKEKSKHKHDDHVEGTVMEPVTELAMSEVIGVDIAANETIEPVVQAAPEPVVDPAELAAAEAAERLEIENIRARRQLQEDIASAVGWTTGRASDFIDECSPTELDDVKAVISGVHHPQKLKSVVVEIVNRNLKPKVAK